MSKSTARRRKRDTKSKALAETTTSTVSDITKYVVKQAHPVDVVDYPDTNVSVPCPDDAALPCSTFLGSISSQTANGCVNDKGCICKSCNTSWMMPSGENRKSLVSTGNAISSTVSKKKHKKPTLVARNSQITDYFPIRRSNRQTSVNKITERNKIIEDAILSGKEDGFEIKVFPDKGRGVITTKPIKRGEFVLEYYGELIDYEEAKRREGIYSDKENIGCYMYYFRFRNKQYCIDATKETDRLGRLVNHSKKGNLKTRTFLIEESPHLALFACRDIQAGEELSYDYGDRRKTALESHPWLAS